MTKKEMLAQDIDFALEELWTKYYEMEKIDDGDIDPVMQMKYEELVNQIADIIYRCGEANRKPKVNSVVERQYDAHNDMTYIMQKVFVGDDLKSCVVLGWYYGKPDPKVTTDYIGNQIVI